MPFEYPDHPNRNRIDPTRNESVDNPFSDPSGQQEADADPGNPYTASVVDDPVPYQPRDHQTTFRHRGGQIMLLGIAGLATWVLAATGLIVGFGTGTVVSGTLIPLSAAAMLLGLPMSWAAWLMGRHDYAAIKAGAMEPEGERSTRIGSRAGMLGTLGGWGVVLVLIVLAIVSVIQEG